MSLEQQLDDGGSRRASEEMLKGLKGYVDDIRTDCANGVYARRDLNESTRFCRWDGQSDDGRKRRAALNKDARPFEGASDSRIRLADQITNEQVAELTTAAMRSIPRAIGIEGTDEKAAGKIQTLVRWLIRNQWGSRYRRTIELLGQYMVGDSPGGAMLSVSWKQERMLESRKVTRDSLVETYASALMSLGVEVTEETLAAAAGIIADPARKEEVKDIIRAMLPHLKESRVTQLARALADEGEAMIPVPFTKPGLPELAALRLYEDVFFPANTTDIQSAQCVIVREWLTKAQVLERAGTDAWDTAFVEELVGDERNRGKDGQTAFPETDYATDVTLAMGREDERDDLYEILTWFVKTANEDGIPGVQVYKGSYHCDRLAKNRELLGYAHGQYPFVYFPREIITARLTDSRGIPELAMSQQQSLKLLTDSVEDHVQVSTCPPTLVPRGKPRYARVWEPFGQVEVDPRDRFEPVKTPQYPQAADMHRAEILRQINEYYGRPAANVDPGVILMLRQARVDRFLDCLADGMMMVVQLCQQYMEPAQLQRITGGQGIQIAQTIEEIQGKYDIHLSFDVRDMDMEYILKKAEVAMKYIMPMDRQATSRWDKFVQRMWESIDPNWAEEFVQPVEEANQRETQDEQNKFVQMLNGVRPNRPEQGENFQLRLQVFERLMAERMSNEAAFPPISAATRVLLQEHMDYLNFQSQQIENAQIGRQGFSENDLGNPADTGTEAAGAGMQDAGYGMQDAGGMA